MLDCASLAAKFILPGESSSLFMIIQPLFSEPSTNASMSPVTSNSTHNPSISLVIPT